MAYSPMVDTCSLAMEMAAPSRPPTFMALLLYSPLRTTAPKPTMAAAIWSNRIRLYTLEPTTPTTIDPPGVVGDFAPLNIAGVRSRPVASNPPPDTLLRPLNGPERALSQYLTT